MLRSDPLVKEITRPRGTQERRGILKRGDTREEGHTNVEVCTNKGGGHKKKVVH